VARVEALEASIAVDAKADVAILETKVKATLKSMGADVNKFFSKL